LTWRKTCSRVQKSRREKRERRGRRRGEAELRELTGERWEFGSPPPPCVGGRPRGRPRGGDRRAVKGEGEERQTQRNRIRDEEGRYRGWMERFLIARKLITGRAQPNDRIVIQYRAQSHTVTLSRTKQLVSSVS
jgi:hypothetical protein